MQKRFCKSITPLEREPPNKELIDALIAISVVSGEIADKLQNINMEGDNQNEKRKGNHTVVRQSDCLWG